MIRKKRILWIGLGIFFVISLALLALRYVGWKKIEIEEIGSFLVPNSWSCHGENRELYFTNAEGKIIMQRPAQNHDLREDSHITGVLYANGAYWSKNGLATTVIGVPNEYYLLDFSGAYFVVYDENVTESTVKKIAKSFIRG